MGTQKVAAEKDPVKKAALEASLKVHQTEQQMQKGLTTVGKAKRAFAVAKKTGYRLFEAHEALLHAQITVETAKASRDRATAELVLKEIDARSKGQGSVGASNTTGSSPSGSNSGSSGGSNSGSSGGSNSGSSSGKNSGSSSGSNSGSSGGKNSGSSSGSNSGVGVPESMSKREAEQMLNNAIRNEKTAHAKDKYLKVKASLEIMKHPESASGLNKT